MLTRGDLTSPIGGEKSADAIVALIWHEGRYFGKGWRSQAGGSADFAPQQRNEREGLNFKSLPISTGGFAVHRNQPLRKAKGKQTQ